MSRFLEDETDLVVSCQITHGSVSVPIGAKLVGVWSRIVVRISCGTGWLR
jgi:hypothetical protein